MKKLLFFLAIFVTLLSVMSCSDNDEDSIDTNQQTILVFMPWSGTDTNDGLLRFFKENIDSIESAIKRNKGLKNYRLMVYINESSTSAKLFEVTYSNSAIKETTIKEYSNYDYTSVNGISRIIDDAIQYAPALNYAMIIGCHGSGWIYKDTWDDNALNKYKRMFSVAGNDYELTRFLGTTSYAIDIPTLSEGIKNSGVKMQYILFDDCYMANAEVAYELRDVTNFLVASTSEIMAMGMPYSTMWNSLIGTTPNYSSITSSFYTFYSSYRVPCGTIAAIDCREIESLAAIMKQINTRFTFDTNKLDDIQILDGYNKTIFYDMDSYVKLLCTDDALYKKFETQLTKVVRSKSNTPQIYSSIYNTGKYIDINTFSGITISDPSINSAALSGMSRTAWYSATH